MSRPAIPPRVPAHPSDRPYVLLLTLVVGLSLLLVVMLVLVWRMMYPAVKVTVRPAPRRQQPQSPPTYQARPYLPPVQAPPQPPSYAITPSPPPPEHPLPRWTGKPASPPIPAWRPVPLPTGVPASNGSGAGVRFGPGPASGTAYPQRGSIPGQGWTSRQRASATAENGAADAWRFDNYVHWLQYVENERAQLRAEQDQRILQQMGRIQGSIFGDTDETDARYTQAVRAAASREIQAMSRASETLIANARATRPEPPSDCGYLDRIYQSAMAIDLSLVRQSLAAYANRDAGTIRQLRREIRKVDDRLQQADAELQRVFANRGVPSTLSIRFVPSNSTR